MKKHPVDWFTYTRDVMSKGCLFGAALIINVSVVPVSSAGKHSYPYTGIPTGGHPGHGKPGYT